MMLMVMMKNYILLIKYLIEDLHFHYNFPINTRSNLKSYLNKLKFDFISNTHNDITKTLPPEIVNSEIAKYFGGRNTRIKKSLKKSS